jgi:CheY-like chemotaxis protein
MPGGGDMFIKTENVYLDKKRADDIDRKSGRYIKLTVRDTGCGIKKEIIKKIFDPFFTTKKRCDGTGLGLASTYGIIKNHKGCIQVISSPGKGTTFTIYLFSSARQSEIKQKKPPEITKRHETILLIDDEKRVTDATCDVIREIGYTVLTANSGMEGIQKYMENSENIDLVILDMVMPGLSGCETFDYIRKINPEVKVLLSCGYSQNGEIGGLLKQGCCGFLQKPYNLNQISDKINSVLKQEKKIAKVS